MKKRVLLLYWTAFFIFCFSSVISAVDRTARSSVIFSSGLKPYRESWEGIKEFLEAEKVVLWTAKYNLKEKKPEEILSQIRREKPDVVFTLGTRAS
ncbi:hypothetical protein KJ693_07840, partial [bacterium]|nr:hypothetical protein [bacterium]MBU1615209.1 hypothetical protein [bacterium]